MEEEAAVLAVVAADDGDDADPAAVFFDVGESTALAPNGVQVGLDRSSACRA